MSFLLWEYLRAKTREAVLAGVGDALMTIEELDRWQPRAEQVRQLTERLRQAENLCARSAGAPSLGESSDAPPGVVAALPAGSGAPTGMSQRSPYGNQPPRKKGRPAKRARHHAHDPRTSDS